MISSNANKALLMAIEHFGGNKQLADYLGIDKSNVSHWLGGRMPLAIKHALKIVKATNGKITMAMLRPDIYQLFK